MLSFDITDRNIRIVKGVEGNGKIKISSAATLNLEEEVIVNGHVKDIPRVATLINGVLRSNKMADKEAIVSISSNLTIFKELYVARAKGQDFQKAVKQQMLSELNLDDSYCVSYAIVGEGEEKNEEGEQLVKVLATACPYEIVNSYREVFKMLYISLKSVMIGCNCITKVLLADTKIKSKMPLLAVQIDNNFISLNLYEQGQLSFSRFASIDATDYGNSADYVFEAVNENIFRMLQFHKSRSTGETIENVIFYGDTHEYVRLTDELEKLDLKTSLINVPPQIHGHENLEFSLYANAIGAMFKRNKDTEMLNLLDTESSVSIKTGSSKGEGLGLKFALGAFALCTIVSLGVYAGMSMYNKTIDNKITALNEKIESKDTKDKLAHYDRLCVMKDKVNSYYTIINNAHDAYYSKPIVLGEKYDLIEETIKKVGEDDGIKNPKAKSIQYADGTFNIEIEYEAKDNEPSQKYPSKLINALLEKEDFITAAYSSYSVSETKNDSNQDVRKVTFSVVLVIKGEQNAYHAPEEETENETEAEQS